MAMKDITIAHAILDDEDLFNNLMNVSVLQIAVCHEDVALRVIGNEKPWVKEWPASYVFKLAKKFPSACEAILARPDLLRRMNIHQLVELRKHYSQDKKLSQLIKENDHIKQRMAQFATLLPFLPNTDVPPAPASDTLSPECSQLLLDANLKRKTLDKMSRQYPAIALLIEEDKNLPQPEDCFNDFYYPPLLLDAEKDEQRALRLMRARKFAKVLTKNYYFPPMVKRIGFRRI